MLLDDLIGRRVAVWGFGREGRSTLQLLRRVLPRQRIALICAAHEAALAGSLEGVDLLTTEPDAATLGGFDVVVKSPGISPYRTPVAQASALGVRFTSATALWFAAHPDARVIAVTGSKGKSTTTALIAHLLRAAGHRTALAGNIGMPLTDLWRPDPVPAYWVVELSSFQTREAGEHELGVLTALFPEHLDWHGDVETYFADKLDLFTRSRRRVLNGLDATVRARMRSGPGDVSFGTRDGWHPLGESIARGAQGFELPAGFALTGVHNRMNLCAALAAVDALGVDAADLLASLAGFRALPHRLQPLGERGGRSWIDDSIATTPQATLAALAALRGRDVVLIAGGYDRGLDWSPLVRALCESPIAAVICQGASGPRVAAAIRNGAPGQSVIEAADFQDAVAQAADRAGRGGVVLLSPGAPSFPDFRDFVERGRRFARLAGFDDEKSDAIGGLGIH